MQDRKSLNPPCGILPVSGTGAVALGCIGDDHRSGGLVLRDDDRTPARDDRWGYRTVDAVMLGKVFNVQATEAHVFEAESGYVRVPNLDLAAGDNRG